MYHYFKNQVKLISIWSIIIYLLSKPSNYNDIDWSIEIGDYVFTDDLSINSFERQLIDFIICYFFKKKSSQKEQQLKQFHF